MHKTFTEATDYLRKHYEHQPEIGIILGTGLGGLVDQIEQEKVIAYNFIPHFPISTVESHFGRLIFGKIGNKRVVAMQGRFHYYEGYTMKEVTFPIRILKLLGIHTLLISNAAGAMNPDYRAGDLVVLNDHINLQGSNPLIGPNLSEFGPRFPDMSHPYDSYLSEAVLAIGKERGYRIHQGVYVGVAGPNLETRAEYRFLRIIGADLVGMSTVPEVLVARHMGLKVCAVSVVTNAEASEDTEPTLLTEVIDIAKEAEPRLTDVFSTLVRQM
ncbi:MAG: purine-nucleoside phosphorylase [Bacteroidota bacterium]